MPRPPPCRDRKSRGACASDNEPSATREHTRVLTLPLQLSPCTPPACRAFAQYNAKFSAETTQLDEYRDGSFNTAPRLTATAEEAGWDSSPWKYVPHSLKGIKPVTNEPWARDEAVYNESRNAVDRRDVPADALAVMAADDSTWDATLRPPEGAMRAYPA